MRASEMLTAEPMPPAVIEELQNLVSRLSCLRDNFDTLANDFGVLIDQAPMPATPEGETPGLDGLDGLRTEIARINTQVALIEQLHERLFAARSQLFGFGGGEGQATDNPIPNTPGNYPPIKAGNFRTH